MRPHNCGHGIAFQLSLVIPLAFSQWPEWKVERYACSSSYVCQREAPRLPGPASVVLCAYGEQSKLIFKGFFKENYVCVVFKCRIKFFVPEFKTALKTMFNLMFTPEKKTICLHVLPIA